MAQKNASTGYQYPYPPEPRSWGQEERQFSNGLRRLFDILFARKLQNVLIADGAVNGRTIAEKSVALRHLVEGFGDELDISRNATIESLDDAIESLDDEVQAIPGGLLPVGTIVMMPRAPDFGSWQEFDLGLENVTAWKRVG